MTSISPIAALLPVLAPLPGATLVPAAPALPAPAPPAEPASEPGESAAMRLDQLFMSRQLSFPSADAGALATGWRAMVGHYRATLIERELRAHSGMLAPAARLAAQEGRVLRQDAALAPADPWRFTVHAGSARAQQLKVVARGPDAPPGRRRRARVALRLELEMDDGARIAVQVEPLPDGVALDIAAPTPALKTWLRTLQPQLQQAVERAGLRVVRWSVADLLAPSSGSHAALASLDVASVLTLPVFRAVAELALLLPACADAGAP
ncbi:MAG: hypothetical protein ACLGI6_14240 [Gammaproteobacteria bacterium]